MVEVEAIIDYINKIKKLLDFGVDISFLNKRYVKKDKVDTLLCCVLAKLPNSYKRKIRTSTSKFSSVNAFKLLQDNLTKKAWFSSSMYVIDYAKTKQLIDSVLQTIRRGIDDLEKEANR